MIATSNSTTTERLSISEEMVDSYLETIEGTTETIATYRYVLTAFCRWLPNSELFVSGMEEYQQWLVEKGLSVQTIKMRICRTRRTKTTFRFQEIFQRCCCVNVGIHRQRTVPVDNQ